MHNFKDSIPLYYSLKSLQKKMFLTFAQKDLRNRVKHRNVLSCYQFASLQGCQLWAFVKHLPYKSRFKIGYPLFEFKYYHDF